MKKIKLIIWLLIIVVIGVVIYQNKAFFMAKEVFHLNAIAASYVSPAVPIAVVFVGFFVVGLIVAFLFSIPGRLKANKTIRALNATINSQKADLAALKSEVDALKQTVPAEPAQPMPASEPEPSTTAS